MDPQEQTQLLVEKPTTTGMRLSLNLTLETELVLAQFVKHFGKYGEITDSVIMKDRKTGQPRGFGFVTYADPSVVDQVIQDTHIINGKQVEIKRTIPKGAIGSKDFKTKKIFVGGIPTAVTEDEFKEFFMQYGEVIEHQIMRDHSTNRSRGFGFITFDSEETVDDLLAKGNKLELAGTQVEIKKAEPKKPNAAPPPSKRYNDSRPAFGGGFGDAYDGYGGSGFGGGGGAAAAAYRSGGVYGGRASTYGEYNGGEFGGYGGYGGGGIGAYRGEPSYGYSGRYGGGFSRGYDLRGGYGGLGEGYGGYGSGSGSGSGSGGGYGSGGGGGYGSGGGYGGGYDTGLGVGMEVAVEVPFMEVEGDMVVRGIIFNEIALTRIVMLMEKLAMDECLLPASIDEDDEEETNNERVLVSKTPVLHLSCRKKERERDHMHPYKVIEITPPPKNLGIRCFHPQNLQCGESVTIEGQAYTIAAVTHRYQLRKGRKQQEVKLCLISTKNLIALRPINVSRAVVSRTLLGLLNHQSYHMPTVFPTIPIGSHRNLSLAGGGTRQRDRCFMDSFSNGVDSSSKTQNSTAIVGNNPPATSLDPRCSRPPSAKQSRYEGSTTYYASVNNPGMKHPNGSATNQKHSYKMAHDPMKYKELPDMAKHYYSPHKGKPEFDVK
ncbi:hypothetical protein GH714_018326 [Hevea brasiliensis]|uniref:RRM domain-containing protein n=1 Tax=Hevea brasiliensis TaxID=3981 RepID=A0A6A6KWD0_HEVBR|nr:hypothetical protein GH714_018326 [Hevea brasiliensis]